MADIGTALARLSSLAAENPTSISDHVRLSGDAVYFADLAKIVGDERGEVIEVTSTSAEETKQKLLDNPADLLSLIKYVDNTPVRVSVPAPPSRYMRGSVVTDFSKENENELRADGLLINAGIAYTPLDDLSLAGLEREYIYKTDSSTPPSMSPITVAIIGATGDLGLRVIRRFLSQEYSPSQISRVKFFTRNPSSAGAQELKTLGAEPIEGEVTAAALKGTDVFISLIGGATDLDYMNKYAKEAVDAGVKVYIPSEYGIDHRDNSDVHHEVFDNKEAHHHYASSISGGKVKIVSLYVGLFLEDTFSLGATLGIDTKNAIYTSFGSPDNLITFNSREDISSSIVRISVLAAADPNSVPDFTRINGSAVSYNQLAALVGKARGTEIKVVEVEDAESKKLLSTNDPLARFWVALRYIYGHGVTDFTKDNANEILNPGQNYWKWKNMEDWVEETKGV
ncbi:hypothetical protein FRC01_000942 [Tulasnella sp. 417]|nr:hypothetical protein FRC01_000942 [Tulasnella sp. 417]